MVWIPTDVLIETAYRRVVPLYTFDDRDRPYLCASSVPFQIGSMRLLITAAHCAFQRGKPLPLFVSGENRPYALTELRGAWEYREGQQPDLDIAVLALDRQSADDLGSLHWFSSPDEVSVVKPKTPGIHYLIVGYPASRNHRRPPKYGLPSRATALVTGDVSSIDAIRGVDKTEEFHFAIAFPHKAVPKPGGGRFSVPPPYGMSGGGVWRVEIDTVQRLANKPLLVGIGVEYHNAHKAFVATRIQAAAPLVRDLADATTPATIT